MNLLLTSAEPTLHLWLLEVLEAGDPGRDSSVLSEEEKRRVARFVRAQDRTLYTFAHTALRGLLGERLGLRPQDVPFTREPCPCCGGPHGRPAVAIELPVPLHFSLSHCEDFVMIGIAATPVGVDVEPLPALEIVDNLITKLHVAEQADLAALPEERRRAALAQIWTRKEAYLKGLGTGLGRSLSADYVGTADMPSLPAGWHIADLPVDHNHAAAWALLGAPPAVELCLGM